MMHEKRALTLEESNQAKSKLPSVVVDAVSFIVPSSLHALGSLRGGRRGAYGGAVDVLRGA